MIEFFKVNPVDKCLKDVLDEGDLPVLLPKEEIEESFLLDPVVEFKDSSSSIVHALGDMDRF